MEYKKQDEIKPIVERAFREIHDNTFVKYRFCFKDSSESDQTELHISLIDNKEENKALTERMGRKRSQQMSSMVKI